MEMEKGGMGLLMYLPCLRVGRWGSLRLRVFLPPVQQSPVELSRAS